MSIVIIVEGKNDRSRLRRLVTGEEVEILCTFGTLNTLKLEQLKKQIGDREVFLFTDNDASGKKIRAALRDAFPDAVQMYTRRGYAGVEGTPEEYLIQQLEKAGLDEYIVYPDPLPTEGTASGKSQSSS
ncbi:toprim domain-containing protein [Paenibacillus sp. y28]|uniref:toprim domain-containing protein n=1 Tax=Paenibacillus sp. y28 TaxID=3129110 RepID=UPI003016FCE7